MVTRKFIRQAQVSSRRFHGFISLLILLILATGLAACTSPDKSAPASSGNASDGASASADTSATTKDSADANADSETAPEAAESPTDPQATTAIQQQASKIEIEQVVVDAPQITAYLRLDNGASFGAENVSATLEKEPLSTKSVTNIAESGNGTTYYVLVDVSTSISYSQMEATKQALQLFYTQLANDESDDRFVLLSFGEQVSTLLAGQEGYDTALIQIAQLEPNQEGTVFNEAISKAIEISDVQSNFPQRKVALVISDGMPYGDNYTKDEVSTSLQNSSLPLYVLCINNSNQNGSADPSAFGELARASGGAIEVAQPYDYDAIGNGIIALVNRINSMQVVNLEAPDNQINNSTELFTITMDFAGTVIKAETPAKAARHQPDYQAPEVLQTEQTGDSRITISFSERLNANKANDSASYLVKDANGEKQDIATANYRTDGLVSYTEIELAGVPYDGNYSLEFMGLTDSSMEANLLTQNVEFELKGQPVALLVLRTIFFSFWWVLLIIALLIVGFIAYRILRKRKGLVQINGQIGFGDTLEYKQRFSTPGSRQIRIIVTDTKGDSANIDLEMFKSVFVGRSSTNNLSFDDGKMSRQHFVIEDEGGHFFINDLGTTNGTFVNGVRLDGRHLLSTDDVITAGNEKFIFKGLIKENRQ